MQASHINAQQGSLSLILGTTMQIGNGFVQTLSTSRAQGVQRAQYAPLREHFHTSQERNGS